MIAVVIVSELINPDSSGIVTPRNRKWILIKGPQFRHRRHRIIIIVVTVRQIPFRFKTPDGGFRHLLRPHRRVVKR